jgi:glycosyltransferase involved in cell wall biosynthesis
MKLCHVVPSLQEQHGGPSKSVRALCRAFARAGHHVDLLTTAPDAPSDGTETSDGANVRIRTFRRDTPDRLCPSRGLRRALQQLETDIIHHHSLWLRTLHYAHGAAATRNVPLVISPRGMMSAWAWAHHPWRKRASNLLVHPGALRSAAGWHATSTDERADITGRGFAQSVCVAPNGVDAPSDADIAAAAAFWRQACPEVTTRRTALFYGRFHQKKRVIELIDVWLESAPRDWFLLLVGLPEDYTPTMLDQYITKSSGAGRARAFAGAGRPAPYAVASLFLLPSHSENFGLTIAEAMAHGVPAVVTDTTPWTELNASGNGWCTAWSEYRAAMVDATSRPADDLARCGQRARQWVLSRYSWDRAADRLNQFYAGLRPSIS